MVFHNPFSNKNIQIFHQLFSKLTRSILIQTNPVHRIAFRMSSDLRRKNHSDLYWHQQTILYLSFHQWNINRHGYNNFYQINFIKLWYPPPEKHTRRCVAVLLWTTWGLNSYAIRELYSESSLKITLWAIFLHSNNCIGFIIYNLHLNLCRLKCFCQNDSGTIS